ncbi:MAG: hypothetical protein ABFS34_05680 [Gemmatimonadota bacterium]
MTLLQMLSVVALGMGTLLLTRRRHRGLNDALASVPALAVSFPGAFLVISEKRSGKFTQFRKPDSPEENVILLAVPRAQWSDEQWAELIADLQELDEDPQAVLRSSQNGTHVEFLEVSVSGPLSDVAMQAERLARAVFERQSVSLRQGRFHVKKNLDVDPRRQREAYEDFFRIAAARGPSALARRMAQRQLDRLENDRQSRRGH